ncbi:MAG: uroporphyrinogen decarboxylase family protein [Syntrophorhabdales bacterium]|jgi:[methyl-Co(III) methanol-specific corrinoid protein]:coenzyme M methyltransferase
MKTPSPRERLLAVLRKEQEKVDRPPVICVGGMMNAAVVEIMEKTIHKLPEAHRDARLMAALAFDIHEQTGFENFALPFCMTVEAEALGSTVSLGSLSSEPKIEKEAFPSVSLVEMRDFDRAVRPGRIETVLKAVEILSQSHPHLPVIGTLTGPISLTASLVDPLTFYKELRTKPERSHEVLDYVSDFLGTFAEQMVERGASCIAIGDPSATGEILGPRAFKEYAVRYVNRVADRVHIAGAPVILHICGNMNSVRHLLPEMRCDAISLDALVSLASVKEDFPELVTMGNVSTYLLEFGDAHKVARTTRRLLRDGVDIISPACGLSTSTSLDLIRAMTRTAKETHPRG